MENTKKYSNKNLELKTLIAFINLIYLLKK